MKCQNCEKLRKEIDMLKELICIARLEEWDKDEIYKDILKGNEAIKENGKPNLKFAEWFAKRYDID